MKKWIKSVIPALFFALAVQAAPLHQEDFIIVTDGVVYATPNDYTSAQYVVVELINANGGVQASVTAQPGQTVRFTLNDASRRVKSTYHMANGQEYIVVDELSM